ncbi:NAD(P)/FAD-dependent oxidoreductase [Cytobacillus purgationiresistens]|uniref:D-amino-acid dehydrogenase n=1 Tax=Cytobacillus purgationiresistens TaxID=863449 RepID=A0ABU0AB77_9BACI|nr:FAD-dependent oxidoreductase [Cytobacillus purgationiresistens]MDQ0268499.1 D-amino-acid dehydrogenase [Cytobacillus purgationiresistens]
MKTYIVIGAGILGASTAYHLAKSGENVILMDRQDPGQATEAAAGIVCPWLSQRRNKAWYSLAKNGAKYYAELIPQLERDAEADTGYKKVGAISIHTDEAKLAKMEERVHKRREDAPEIGDIQQLSGKATNELFPPLSADYSSVQVSGAARVNGKLLRKALIQGAEKYGATVIHGEASIAMNERIIIGAKVNGELYKAEKVIVTAGVWAKELFKPLGIDFHVTAQKAQIIHLHLPDTETDDWPVVQPPNNQYILTFDKGKVVVGATHEDEHNFDTRVTAGGLHEVLHKALTSAPGLEHSTVTDTKVGFRPFTPGFLPVIGQLPGYAGLLAANGLGASGLTTGPFLGAQLAKLAKEEELDIDLSLYDIGQAAESCEPISELDSYL